MKRSIALALSALLLLCLCACGNSGSRETEPPVRQTQPPVIPEGTYECDGTSVQENLENYFDNAAFIGDSVTLKLQYYNADTAALGKATFLCAGSYSVHHAVRGTLNVAYQGQEMAPEDALAACGAKKVFIMLGMNDIGLYGVDDTITTWATLVQKIREKNPGIHIFIQSGSPIYTGGEKGKLTNANMDAYNVKLEKFADENDCFYVDVASSLKDSTGGLKPEYCSDKYVHFTAKGCSVWVDVLKDYVG